MNQNSIEAYNSKKPRLQTDHQKILHALERMHDATDKAFNPYEISKLTKMDVSKVFRRMSELVKDNKVEVIGNTVGENGRKCMAYKLKINNKN